MIDHDHRIQVSSNMDNLLPLPTKGFIWRLDSSCFVNRSSGVYQDSRRGYIGLGGPLFLGSIGV
jgi:hypothetical protein